MSILIGNGRRAVRATDSANAWEQSRNRGPPRIPLATLASELPTSNAVQYFVAIAPPVPPIVVTIDSVPRVKRTNANSR